MSRTLIDQQARDAIKNDLNTTFFIEAGAGSGKTHGLVERVAALVETGHATIDRIAAVTFTRKAAGELKERIQDRLEKRFNELPEGEARRRIEVALLDLERGFIGTIHSFCERLLRERPVEARLDPEFRTVEENEEQPLADQVWREYVLELQTNDDTVIPAVEDTGLTLDDLKSIYDRLRLYPEVEFPCEVGPKVDPGPALQALDRFLATVLPLMPPSPVEGRWDPLQETIRTVARDRELKDLTGEREFCRAFGLLDRRLRVTQKRWPTRDDALAAQKAFDTFRETVVGPVLQSIREYRYGKVLPIVLPAVRRVGARREALSILNFQDLLLRTASALRDNPELRRYLQRRYTHLLVDEFQDTDPIQAEVMFYLTGEDCEERDWRKLVPRPGSLFVVGDPKQAIYRFRRADIDTYNLVKRLIRNGGGRVVHLKTNFRSIPALAGFINPVFKGVFPENETEYQAAFAPMHTVREPVSGALAGIRKITIPYVRGHLPAEIARLDAQRIARWIRWAVDARLTVARSEGEASPVRPDDILVLLRYKDALATYARALEEHGIPYNISGGSGLKDVLPLAQAHTLLSCVARPDNPVFLAGVLRGPFFGFSDQDLWEYRDAGGCFSIFASVPEGLRPEVAGAFAGAFAKLRLYYRWSRTMPASTAIRLILDDVGLLPWILSEPMARSGAANLLMTRELLAVYEAAGKTAFTDLVARFGELIETGTEDELNLDEGGEGAVRLTNLHRAKGLEAPVVFLAHPGKTLSIAPSVYVDRTGVRPRGYLRVNAGGPYGPGPVVAAPPGWGDLQAREQRYQDAEEMRLLYVAATRAKDLLVVSTYEAKPEKSPWFLFDEWLKDVPELDLPPDMPRVDAGSAGAPVSAKDFVTAREHLAGCWETQKAPSYAVCPVTELVKQGDAPERRTGGKGASWGRAVHRLLERFARGERDLDCRAEIILREEGRPAEEKDDLLDLLREIENTGFWQRVTGSMERLVEAALAAMDVAQDAAGRSIPTVTQGIIDLAFREDRGWVLVEFKTDCYETTHERNALVAYYTPQLQVYARLWERATGVAPVETGIFFTHGKEYFNVRIPGSE